MTFLVPLMMWGWIPFNIILFRKFSPQKAILISVIGGVLFLPVTTYDIPLIDYNKETAIAISLLVGIIFSGKLTELAFRPRKYDIPIIIWCIISPFLSLMVNGYGFKNALFAIINTPLQWGSYYLLGRIYFSDKESLRLLSKGIIAGGLIYVPLVLFELRMSPQLSNIFYGFCPHNFLQLIRYGGFRPIVFMDHSLMVALWMAATYTVSFWLYRTGEVARMKVIPMALTVFMLLVVTVLSKCAASIVYLILGTLGYYYFKKFKSKKIFKLFILAIPVYIILRISGILPVETILAYFSKLFNAERIESLSTRLFQEEIFGRRAQERSLLGWGGMDRAWPMNPFTGEIAVQMIDSLYLIAFSIRGYLGLFSLYAVLLLGPWKIMKSHTKFTDAIVLSIIVILFTIDSLLNAMMNPVYVLTAGALISFSESLKDDELSESEDLDNIKDLGNT